MPYCTYLLISVHEELYTVNYTVLYNEHTSWLEYMKNYILCTIYAILYVPPDLRTWSTVNVDLSRTYILPPDWRTWSPVNIDLCSTYILPPDLRTWSTVNNDLFRTYIHNTSWFAYMRNGTQRSPKRPPPPCTATASRGSSSLNSKKNTKINISISTLFDFEK